MKNRDSIFDNPDILSKQRIVPEEIEQSGFSGSENHDQYI